MKTLIKILCLLSLSFISIAGDGVGNGGGISENNFIFAYNTIGEYIEHSLKMNVSAFSKKEETILRKIHNALPEQYQLKKPIVFMSGTKYPHIFIYPFGEVRIAVTGSKVPSPIYINTDLLYQNINGEIKYISISQAISILVHELGHHHNVKDENFLNELGSKVAKSVYNKFERRNLRKDKNIYFEFINLGEEQLSQLLLTDSQNSFELSNDLSKKSKCNNGKVPMGIEIWQSSWTRYSHTSWYLKNELILYCKINNEVKPQGNAEYLVFPKFKKDGEANIIEGYTSIVKECDMSTSSCMAKQQEVLNFIENKKYKFLEEK